MSEEGNVQGKSVRIPLRRGTLDEVISVFHSQLNWA